MHVSVEAPSKLERRITVTVPVEKMTEAYDKHISKLAKNAKIAGFRPGKAPLSVIRQRYGESARKEALSEIIQSSLYDAIHQEKLNPVGVPAVEPKVVELNQPLEFVATFEIMPEVEEFHFKLATLEKKIATITEVDIEKVIEHLRMQQVKWKKVERAAQNKDQVIIDFHGAIQGVPFAGGEAHDYSLVLGSNTMIPGFEDGMIGMSKGEEKVIPVTFPENYPSKDVAGKVAEFTIKVITISEPELPELNEAFIKTLGIKTGQIADLHAEIKKNLEREMERVISLKLKNQVFDVLLEQNTVDVPHAMIEQEANRIHDEVHPHHGQPHHHTKEEMARFNEIAKRNVSLGLLVAAIVKHYKLSVSAERVQAYLTKIAAAYEDPTEVMKWYSNNKQAQAEIEMHSLEEQIVEKLLEQVQVTDKMISYHALVNSK